MQSDSEGEGLVLSDNLGLSDNLVWYLEIVISKGNGELCLAKSSPQDAQYAFARLSLFSNSLHSQLALTGLPCMLQFLAGFHHKT